MFEKGLLEWVDEMYPCDSHAQRYLIEGAIFGYNKAKELEKRSRAKKKQNGELTDKVKELEAGRPQWHKVADGDLPSEEDGWAWVCNQDGLPCFFNWGTREWLDCEGTQIRTTEWCYMPHKE